MMWDSPLTENLKIAKNFGSHISLHRLCRVMWVDSNAINPPFTEHNSSFMMTRSTNSPQKGLECENLQMLIRTDQRSVI